MELCLLTKGIHKHDGIKFAYGYSDRLATYKNEGESFVFYTIYTKKPNKKLAERVAKFYRSWDKDTFVKVIPDNGRIFCVCLKPQKKEFYCL